MGSSDDEVQQAQLAKERTPPVNGVVTWGAQLRAIMTKAVELHDAKRARLKPSGQVAEDERMVRAVISRCRDFGATEEDALARLAAGAQEASALRTQLAEMTDLRDGYRKAGALEHARADMAEASHAAIRERAGNKVEAGHQLHMAMLKEPTRAWSAAKYEDRAAEFARWVLEGDIPPCVASGQEPATALEQDQSALGAKCVAEVNAFQERDARAKSEIDAERVKERSEAMWKIVAPDAPPDSSVAACEGDASWTAGFEFGKEQGAEAMRAACIIAVREAYTSSGGCVSINDLKAAIEGATP